MLMDRVWGPIPDCPYMLEHTVMSNLEVEQMNEYEKLKAAMNAELNKKACPECKGRGQFNDAEPGDISCKEWDCPDCRGTGLKAVVKESSLKGE